jgi:hypothetical protein
LQRANPHPFRSRQTTASRVAGAPSTGAASPDSETVATTDAPVALPQLTEDQAEKPEESLIGFMIALFCRACWLC